MQVKRLRIGQKGGYVVGVRGVSKVPALAVLSVAPHLFVVLGRRRHIAGAANPARSVSRPEVPVDTRAAGEILRLARVGRLPSGFYL